MNLPDKPNPFVADSPILAQFTRDERARLFAEWPLIRRLIDAMFPSYLVDPDEAQAAADVAAHQARVRGG